MKWESELKRGAQKGRFSKGLSDCATSSVTVILRKEKKRKEN